MKQVFLLSLMILTLMSCNSKKEQLCTSTWQDEAIVIDGQNNDWGGTLRYSDTTAKLSYDVRNDSENLYLIVETNDNSMRMKLAHTGLKVSVGLKSDPTATAAITLPAFRENPCMHRMTGMPDSACKAGMGPKPEIKDGKCAKPCGAKKDSACAKHCGDRKDHKGPGKGKPMPDSIRHKCPMPGMPDSAACMNHMPKREPAKAEGFKYSNGNIEGCAAEKGKISFAIGMSNPQTLTYEIAVPLREIYGDGYDLAKVAIGKIKLELAVEAIEKPSCPGMMKGGPMSGGPGAPDSLAAHHCEGMPGGPAGMHEGKPEGGPEGKTEGKPECRPEGMQGVPRKEWDIPLQCRIRPFCFRNKAFSAMSPWQQANKTAHYIP